MITKVRISNSSRQPETHIKESWTLKDFKQRRLPYLKEVYAGASSMSCYRGIPIKGFRSVVASDGILYRMVMFNQRDNTFSTLGYVAGKQEAYQYIDKLLEGGEEVARVPLDDEAVRQWQMVSPYYAQLDHATIERVVATLQEAGVWE